MAARKMAAAVALGRRGGKSTSDAKKRAVRENGRKGGSPTHRDVFIAGWIAALNADEDEQHNFAGAYEDWRQSRKTPKEPTS